MKIPPAPPVPPSFGPQPPMGGTPESPGQQAAQDARWITGLLNMITTEMQSHDSTKVKTENISNWMKELKSKTEDLTKLASDFPQYTFIKPMLNGLVDQVQDITSVPVAEYAKTPPDPNDLLTLALVEGQSQTIFSLLNSLYPPS